MVEKHFFRNLPQLETRRLILRKVRLDDAEDMYHYAADPAVSQYVLWSPHHSLADTVSIVKGMLHKYETGEVSEWCLIEKASRRMIGTCGFVYVYAEHNRAEIGYAMGQAYWGKGLMTEAVHKVMEYAFERLKLNRIEARCVVENAASSKLMEKVGMQFEGVLREQILIKGHYFDVRMYAMLREEYTALHQNIGA